ncbi:hypothetical protein SAMN05444162_3244 [Paenibacillaceae bacterium GAS479]|nr:hypothetical protein SAMN05444162_3244 [Paenibacillaceae bacterium GAS479]
MINLDLFGEIVITQVRDKAILHWEKVLSGMMKDEGSKKLFNELKNIIPEDHQDRFVDISSQIVDTTLHYLLLAIEEEREINVSIKNEDGELIEVKELSDGLPGELYSEEGWIIKYSEKRESVK